MGKATGRQRSVRLRAVRVAATLGASVLAKVKSWKSCNVPLPAFRAVARVVSYSHTGTGSDTAQVNGTGPGTRP
eukprot:1668275-Amphidinium_carterae.1